MDMDTVQYIVSSLAWSLGGLGIGFILGRATASMHQAEEEIHEVHEAVLGQHEEAPMSENRHGYRDGGDHEVDGDGHLRLFTKQWWVGIVLLVLAVAMGVQQYFDQRDEDQEDEQLRNLVECMDQRYASVASAVDAWVKANAESFGAMDTLVGEVTSAADDEALRQALVEYQETRDAADAQQQENPIIIPDVRCSDLFPATGE